MYSPVSSPLMVYSPASLESPQASPAAARGAHQRPGDGFFLPAAAVTLPVIWAPTCRVASTADLVAGAVTDTGVASEALALPL